MKNLMLTTAICVGSIVTAGLFVNNKLNECSAARTALQTKAIRTIAIQAEPKAQFASAIIPDNKILHTSFASTSFHVNVENLKDEQSMSDEEINDDFMIEHLPVLNYTIQTDDEMNDLFQSENNDLKYTPNFLASDVEINNHFQAENK